MASNTRTRMIETTARLIQARGLHGVSLSEILRESDAPRGSLYFHFPGGKESLVLEAMRAGIREASAILKECLTGSDTPADGVRSFFDAAAGEMTDSGYLFGCPVAPIILDAPESGSELAAECRAAFEDWTKQYREALIRFGVAAGRAERLARTIVASLEGALIMARGERNAGIVREVGDEMALMLTRLTASQSE